MSGLSQFDLDADRTALLLVDLQNDFCKPEGSFASAGHDVSACLAAVERTKRLLEDVRPLGVAVLWTKAIATASPEHRLLPLRFRSGGTESFLPGSWGFELVDELRPKPGDVVIEKPCYSGFLGTPLGEELRRRGVETVAVAGVTTNCCVDTTARDAFMRGFGVVVVSDCVAAFRDEWDLHEASLKNLSLLFAVVASASELLGALRRAVPGPAGADAGP